VDGGFQQSDPSFVNAMPTASGMILVANGEGEFAMLKKPRGRGTVEENGL